MCAITASSKGGLALAHWLAPFYLGNPKVGLVILGGRLPAGVPINTQISKSGSSGPRRRPMMSARPRSTASAATSGSSRRRLPILTRGASSILGLRMWSLGQSALRAV